MEKQEAVNKADTTVSQSEGNIHKTILSGITPSGRLHIGNYFGAMQQHIDLQDQGDAYFFIANYHAMTSRHDGVLMHRHTLDIALDYLALGLDYNTCTFFAQSDVPQVTELSWILGSLCPMGLMEKAVSYKDKISHGLSANVGLFTYPILQAADILIYHADIVPVGADQKQHIEITRDLAVKLNIAYNQNLLRLPEARILEAVATVPGIDGRKMSKSYQNTIGIFDEGKELKKRVMAIETDSTPLESPKDPEKCNVFALIKLFASASDRSYIATKYREGGFGYGHAKKALLEMIDERFSPARDRRKVLANNEDEVHRILALGGEKARDRAEQVMNPIRKATGLVRHF
ncbi:MAG: tryptophan--tRNA ligase [Bacteroidetes bacterium]|nr:tryptophan--tRNA ligase [Bacteroidota bacterium]MCH8524146.1 tryptophan--tRNA ligase [Balneolales bacterium]